MSGETMLGVESLSRSFGGVRAVNDVSFTVGRGAITGLIGPNGAGKTTTFNLVSGLFPPDSGSVRLEGMPLTGLRPDRRPWRGAPSRAPVSSRSSVWRNLRIAALARARLGFWEDWLARPPPAGWRRRHCRRRRPAGAHRLGTRRRAGRRAALRASESARHRPARGASAPVAARRTLRRYESGRDAGRSRWSAASEPAESPWC
jgi:ABC-type branched-subunit amino acid transport system ATPase component